MSDQNTTNVRHEAYTPGPHRKGRVFGGLLVVLVGIAFLLRRTGVDFPGWIFSFETALIVLGMYLGLRHSFRGIVWFIPVAIGGVLLIDDFAPQYDFSDYIWPLVVIGVGLFIMLRPGRRGNDPYWKKWEADHANENFADDYIDSTVLFGGVKKNVISKNFRGGDATTVFGGTDINLMQADISGRVVLDLTQVFGGTKLIVPAHWKVQSEDLVAIFGGVEDKRTILGNAPAVDESRVLVLKGTCLFGGIDIRSY